MYERLAVGFRRYMLCFLKCHYVSGQYHKLKRYHFVSTVNFKSNPIQITPPLLVDQICGPQYKIRTSDMPLYFPPKQNNYLIFASLICGKLPFKIKFYIAELIFLILFQKYKVMHWLMFSSPYIHVN